MVGNDFYYDGHWLSEFGMKVYDPEDTQQFVSRDIDKSDISTLRPIPNHYSAHYSDVLTLSFLIIKDDEDEPLTQEETKLDGEEISYIRAWLESPKIPCEFTSPTEEDVIATTYFGLFTSIQPYLINHECFGMYLTFTCNAPYGFSDVYSKTFNMQGNVTVSGYFANYSAEHNEYLKPTIIIKSADTFVSGETIRIENVSDNNKYMLLAIPEGLSSITIDCQKKCITDNNGNILSLSDVGLTLPISSDYNYVSAELYTFYWLRLLPDRNNLAFTCNENSTIRTVTISSRYIIKSGGF